MDVSTIIPVYNGAAYVAESVASALAQRGVTHEVIVIDDGSTDDTQEVLRQFGDAIRVLLKPNGGCASARNAGARVARGEWLAFLDADDEWLPDKLAKQLVLADNETLLIYTDRFNFGHCDGVPERLSESLRPLDGDVFEPLLLGNFMTVSSALMRHDVFESLGGFYECLLVCEDWDLWLRYAATGMRVGVCNEPLMRYRIHPSSISQNSAKMLQGRLEVLSRAFALPTARDLSWSVRRQAISRVWEWSAGGAATIGQRRRALSWYFRASLYWPFNAALYKGMVKCCLGMA